MELDKTKIQNLDLKKLRTRWQKLWRKAPPPKMSKQVLQASIAYKEKELSGEGLSVEQASHLQTLAKQYRKNSNYFDKSSSYIRPGTRLVRIYKGNKYTVIAKNTGFEYCDKNYKSLSKIANEITGSRWNGKIFFGLGKVGGSL